MTSFSTRAGFETLEFGLLLPRRCLRLCLKLEPAGTGRFVRRKFDGERQPARDLEPEPEQRQRDFRPCVQMPAAKPGNGY